MQEPFVREFPALRPKDAAALELEPRMASTAIVSRRLELVSVRRRIPGTPAGHTRVPAHKVQSLIHLPGVCETTFIVNCCEGRR